MLFNSLDYALFLAFALLCFWATARFARLRVGLVLLLSCVFYAAWEPAYLGLILFSSSTDWLVARKIENSRNATQKKRWLLLSIVTNLSLLGTFKYWNFFASSGAVGASWFGLRIHPWLLDVALPVGISFYTFESISYCVDVYRGHCKAAKTPLELLFFITFFPKLVAGPIARPGDLIPQLNQTPTLNRERVGAALFLIASGLIKKVAFADVLSVNLVDRVFDTPDAYTASETIVALYAFTLQIYMDFSGYTDIARGSGKLFGIELPENFERPYAASNPAEFWRRWHMSLSTWLRDYLYFPLGGSRLGKARTYFNLWLTIFLIGLWHGASWNFVLYGTIQATAVLLHRLWSSGRAPTTSPAWRHAFNVFLTMQLVVFSRVLFRAPNLDSAAHIVDRIASHTYSCANVSPWIWLALLVGFAAHYTPIGWRTHTLERYQSQNVWVQAALFGLLCFALMQAAGSKTVPYIYFQF